MKFTAQGSRFNFTIKGPKLWGATTTGYLEMDFDVSEQGATAAGVPALANTASSSNNYMPRLRHAMFRFNWPETELLFGQYWSMFCEFYPELVEDGPMQGTGMPTARLPQIRLTQKFLGWGEAALLVGSANNTANGQVYSTSDTSGQSAETPQVQAKLQYQQDLWGKAAYYGKPMPFTARLIGGWQRTHNRSELCPDGSDLRPEHLVQRLCHQRQTPDPEPLDDHGQPVHPGHPHPQRQPGGDRLDFDPVVYRPGR